MFHFKHSTGLLLLAGLASAVLLHGQAVTGSITGIVMDQSGSVVRGAHITVTDLERNTTFTATTNDTGLYVIPQLLPSHYRVQAEMQGFRSYMLNNLPLATDQTATVNITLQIGNVAQQLTVEATPQLVEGSSSTLSAVVSNSRIVDLPLNGRNIYTLTSLVPGVFQTHTNSGIDDTFYGNHFIINGSQEATSDMILDGVSAEVNHNIPTIPAISAIPSVEGIQEFRILTNSYPAEYGRSGGGVVIMSTKSGTNSLHGSAFEFLRNSFLDSNNFFANRSGIPLASFKRNNFGGSVGGPVILPKVYNGKDKTFFFFDYEGTRLYAAQTAIDTVPTALQRQGNFSQTYNSAGQLMTIYNPFSTVSNGAGGYTRTVFSGNTIPVSMLNPVALNMEKYYPAPNTTGLAFTGSGNFVVQSAYPQPEDRDEVRIDHYIDNNNRLMGRYDIMDSIYSKPNFFNNIADPGCCEPMDQRLQSGVLEYTHIMGASKLLSIRGGFGRVAANRTPWSASPTGIGGFNPTQLGLPASISAVANQLEFPNVTIQDMTQLGPNGGDIYHMADTTYTIDGSMSWVVGRHSIQFGEDTRFNLVNFGQIDEPVGSYQFYRSMTQGPNPNNPLSSSGIGFASFLLGTGGGINQTAGYMSDQVDPANANHYSGLYIQDDFKATSKLTLNLGLRWDLESGDTERYNQEMAIDPSIQNPLSQATGLDLKGGALFAGGSLGRRAIKDTNLGEFGPRVGIAYQLTPSTVLRSAYGIYYMAAPYGASRHFLGEAYSSQTTWVASLDGVTPLNTLSNPFPNGFNLFPGTSQGLATEVGTTLDDGIPSTLKTPYNQQWNFTIQKQFGPSMMWEIAYAGNKATHLPYFIPAAELDQLNPSLLSLGSQLTTLVNNPFYGIITTPGTLSQSTVQYGQLLRPYPEYTGFQAKNAAWGNSNYNALETRFERRLSDGLSFMASYTYSKTISDGVDGLWDMSGSVRNWYCLECERSVSSYDQPHRFVVNAIYELPVGRGKPFAANANKFVNAVIGNWQINAIVTLSVGLPLYNFAESTSTCFCFGGTQRPSYNGADVSMGGAQSIYEWFNVGAFSQSAPFTFGNLDRTLTAVRADGAHNIDFSMFKSFKPVEKLSIEFRAEAFNLTNTPIFSEPNTTLGSSTFGVVTSQENNPRQIQLALKLLF